MSEFALRRVRVRSRRRKPRPPRWWMCVVMLTVFAVLAFWDAAAGDWLSLAATAANAVIWWRALLSPPDYWCQRTFWRWWPPALALAIAGVIL